jgi:hypothetical protein
MRGSRENEHRYTLIGGFIMPIEERSNGGRQNVEL